MAQEVPSPTPSLEASKPLAPSNSGSNEANPQPTPPPVTSPAPDNGSVSAASPGETGGAISLTPPPSSFAQPSDNGPTSNDNSDLSSGANPAASPPSGPSLEPGPGTPLWSTASREAANKKWLLLYNFSTGVTYDDNIFISNQHRVADEIFTVSGGFTLGLGDYRNLQENYLLAQYQLTGFFFRSQLPGGLTATAVRSSNPISILQTHSANADPLRVFDRGQPPSRKFRQPNLNRQFSSP